MAEQITDPSTYEPYIDSGEAPATTPYASITPELRVGNPTDVGDPMSDYMGRKDIQWAIAADELEEQARSAQSAESPDAEDLFARAKQAKEKSGYLWWPEENPRRKQEAIAQVFTPPLARSPSNGHLPIITDDETGEKRFMYRDGNLDPRSTVGRTSSIMYSEVPPTPEGVKEGFDSPESTKKPTTEIQTPAQSAGRAALTLIRGAEAA